MMDVEEAAPPTMATDPTPASMLLRHAEFMRALARALLRDASAADDAVQDTWLAALQHPPRDLGTARAWLGRVLRNRVREGHRRATRRVARERACARPASCAAAGDMAARQEVIQLVTRALSALDEPCRSTVLLRHFEGLPPRQIARQMNCPVETVKSRLKRAHMQLRGTLDAVGPGWRTALAPLTGLTLGTGSVGATASTLGALVMTKKLAVAVSVVLVAAVAYVGWRPAADGGAPPDDGPLVDLRVPAGGQDLPSDEVPVLSGVPRSPSAVGGETSPAPRLGSARPAFPGGPTAGLPASGSVAGSGAPLEPIAGVVTVGGFPAREGTVRILGATATGSGDGADPTAVRIDEDGRFRVRPRRQGSVQLVIEVPGYQARTVSVPAGSPTRDPLRVAFGGGRIFGVVQDADGGPAAEVTVRLSSHLLHAGGRLVPSAEGDVFGVHLRTAPDGSYAFTDLPAGRYVVVAEPEKGGSDPRNLRSFAVDLAVGESRRLDIGSRLQDPTWSGTVRYDDGSPVRRAGNLFLVSQDGRRRMYVSFDAEGRYAQPVPPGTYRMEFVFPGPRPRGAMRLVRTDRVLEIPAGGAREDVVLPGSRITGRVLDLVTTTAEPKPPQEVVFTLESSEGELPESLISSPGARPVAVVPVAEDGTFAVDGLPAGLWTVTGSPRPLLAEDGRTARLTIRGGERPGDLRLRPGPTPAGGEDPGR